jgi:3-oxoacyl-[acyl-carrier-protein] synthase II
MDTFLSGIGWVTGAGIGWGNQGGAFTLPDLPLPALGRRDVFPEPNQRFGRMSDYAKLGLAAITFALRDAGLETWSAKRAVGVVASTRLGCLATDLEYHRTVLLQGGGLASPNLFAYTLANCFLGDAAIQFGLTGSSFAINETGEDRFGALRMALEEIALGEADTMLAGICDLPVPGAFSDLVSLRPGAVFLVLSVTPPAVNGYGTVFLADDGKVLHNGSPQGSLFELVRTALAGRLAS